MIGDGGKAALLVHESGQAGLWTSFLTRMMDLKVAGLDESSEVDTAHIVFECWDAGHNPCTPSLPRFIWTNAC